MLLSTICPAAATVITEPAVFAAVGHTPLVRLGRVSTRLGLDVWAKLEGSNPGGSVKDRVALRIVGEAVIDGRLQPGDLVVESSSGNMAVALAQVCRASGLRFRAVVDPDSNVHTRKLLRVYGAEVEVVDEPDAQGSNLTARLARVAELAAAPNTFWPNQYASDEVPRAHRATMHEIVSSLGRAPDVMLAATGTGGTLAGLADHLHEINAATRVVAVDAVGSRIFGGAAGPRHLPGHGSARTSDLLRPEHADQVVAVDDIHAVLGARRLLDLEGVLAGASAGAVMAALDEIAPELTPGSVVALLLSDRGDRYLDTVYDDDWVLNTLGVDLSDGAS